MAAVTRIILFCGLCLATALALSAQEPAPLIRGIVFTNAERLPLEAQAQLAEIATPLVGLVYDEGVGNALREDILTLEFVQDARIATAPVDGDLQVIVELVLFPVIERVEFIGNTALTDAVLLDNLPIGPGEAFTPAAARDGAESIQQQYVERGYTLTTVTDIAFDGTTLSYTIHEPIISEIRIVGAQRTREEVIRELLLVQPGDLFNERHIRESLLNLQRLNIFDELTATPEPGAEPGMIALTFNLTERRTGYLTLGGTYSEVGGLSGYVIFGDANLFGRAQRVNVQLQAGAVDIAQVDYFNPLIGGPRTSLGLGGFYREAERQIVADEEIFRYRARRSGGTATVSQRISPATQYFSTLRIADIRALPGADAAIPEIFLGDSLVRSLALGVARDTRPSPLYPTGGSFSQAVVEGAGLFGGEDFLKVNGEIRRYWPLGGASANRPPRVLAARLLAGTSTGTPPFLDQYFIGGMDTLRGYLSERFVGNHVVLFNGEVRYPLTESIQGVVFADLGDAWGGPFAAALGDEDFNLRLGYGLGVRIATPVGPVRLDFAFDRAGGNEFHFGLGPTF